jgi:uncharacterized repeat protein (TIGR01451 family)
MRKFAHRTLRGLLAALVLLAGSLLGIAQPTVQSAPSSAPAGWQIFPTAATGTIYTVDMLSATDGWAGGIAGFILHYNGSDWVSVPTNFDSPINGIYMLSASSGWGVTYKGQVIRYNGTWTVHSTPAGASLEDIYMLSETDGFAVGGPIDPCAPGGSCLMGAIYRYNGSTWQHVSSPVPYWLTAIDMLSASDGWIVGVGGTVLRWNGTSWQGGSIAPGLALVDVDTLSSTDVWAVGYEVEAGGVLYHWDGSTWTRLDSPNGARLNAVDMVNSNYGWAVGDGGTILRYNGSNWQQVASPVTQAINTVTMVGCSEGWAFARPASILHYSGTTADMSPSRKQVDKIYASPGDRLTYTITAKNAGPCDADGVQVTDAVPANTNYVAGSATTTQGTIIPPSGAEPLRVDVGTIAPGNLATITFQVDVGNTGQTCWFVPNLATVDMGGSQWKFGAVTTIGTCIHAYMPVVFRGW